MLELWLRVEGLIGKTGQQWWQQTHRKRLWKGYRHPLSSEFGSTKSHSWSSETRSGETHPSGQSLWYHSSHRIFCRNPQFRNLFRHISLCFRTISCLGKKNCPDHKPSKAFRWLNRSARAWAPCLGTLRFYRHYRWGHKTVGDPGLRKEWK